MDQENSRNPGWRAGSRSPIRRDRGQKFGGYERSAAEQAGYGRLGGQKFGAYERNASTRAAQIAYGGYRGNRSRSRSRSRSSDDSEGEDYNDIRRDDKHRFFRRSYGSDDDNFIEDGNYSSRSIYGSNAGNSYTRDRHERNNDGTRERNISARDYYGANNNNLRENAYNREYRGSRNETFYNRRSY